MAFSEDAVKQAWDRADGKCECERATHSHSGRCNNPLSWGNRGKEGWGAWEARHISSPHDDSLSSCRIYCWECCKATFKTWKLASK
jgi:hypothetical protein